MTHTRMCQECTVSLEKLSFFFIQVKIIQVLVFDNWHPLKARVYVDGIFPSVFRYTSLREVERGIEVERSDS